jgi:RNA polymerase sigma-70 factor, ECF subfamily
VGTGSARAATFRGPRDDSQPKNAKKGFACVSLGWWVRCGRSSQFAQGTFWWQFSFHSEQGRDVPGFEADETLEQDAQLVQQCLQGDGSAWEDLVRRHSRRIFNICYRFTGNGTEAEDLSQEVFLRVYRTLGSYRSAHGGFATWMTSVTRNLLIDHYRRTKRDRVTDSLDDAMSVVENKESAGRRPDEQVLLGELSSQVQSALTKLSPELREAVILRDLQQLEYVEIQRALSVPEGTVKSRINRGRIELARILQQMGVRPS